MSTPQDTSPWRIVLLLVIMLAILVGVQFLPLSEWTGGRLSNVNLLSSVSDHVFHEDVIMDTAPVDPLLAELEAEDAESPAAVEPADAQVALVSDAPGDTESTSSDTKEHLPDVEVDDTSSKPVVDIQPSKKGDQMIIEDYTVSGQGLANLRNAIRQHRVARIAVLGDSYIEGDIMTQDLREMMQDAFGGNGPGFVAVDPAYGNFRQTVSMGKSSGWSTSTAKSKFDSRYMPITQIYNKSTGNAKASFKGSQKMKHTGRWNKSQFLFIAPNNTTVTLTTDNGSRTFDVRGAADSVQCLSMSGPTSKFDVSVSGAGLVSLGTWLSDSTGVAVDNMSMRGVSGLTLSNLGSRLSQQMNRFVPYDLIILEFGINAMSASQKNYDAYSRRMQKVVETVRRCYPRADIILMGIGDRGQKRGGDYHSMSVCQTMVDAQREAARNAHCLFYDTRESMGGEDAIVDWVRRGLANKDYIHLNIKGGRELAKPLFNAIRQNIER
ncbi:MAG: hypothetical protein HDS07_04350 [Bacteroides sp.]|nr:hypothetical protein [Bacteroides sp.]